MRQKAVAESSEGCWGGGVGRKVVGCEGGGRASSEGEEEEAEEGRVDATAAVEEVRGGVGLVRFDYYCGLSCCVVGLRNVWLQRVAPHCV
jgi:hypothetical protein